MHLELLRNALSKNGSWDFDSEICLILSSFFSCTIDHSATVWDHTVAYCTDLFSNIVDSLFSSRNHHFVVNDLLCTQDNTILANNSKNSTVVKVS